MPEAGRACEAGKGVGIRPAELAGVLGFFATLVESVLSLVCPIWMPEAGRAGEGSNAARFCAAIFAEEVHCAVWRSSWLSEAGCCVEHTVFMRS